MATENVLDEIRTQIIDSGRDRRYRIGAYAFVLAGMEYYLVKCGEKRHVSGQELSIGLLDFALHQFGPMALDVLRYWGIDKTDDLGNIVYNLIAIGRMSRRDEDALDDFHNVIDIPAYFAARDYFHPEASAVKSLRSA